ncbi:MAG: hypothetical protein SGI83_16445 [Bacteroidota bacterium]|nr:hypothetical protein [Bacteroidota bacterium]
MKSIVQPSLYFSPHSLKALKKEPASAQSFNQSPYLKAVLSEKRIAGTARVLSMASSSMAAALRYIAGSK